MRNASLILAAVFLGAAAAGCAGSRPPSSQPALFRPASQVTLTCHAILPNASLADDIATLAADDKAISGQWANAEAEATGDVNGTATPTAAQDKAANDLTSVLGDLNTASEAKGPLAAAVSTLDNDVSRLTNGTPDWQSAGPAVHADITALAATCGQ